MWTNLATRLGRRICCFLVVFSGAHVCAAPPSNIPANIIVVLADDLGYGDLGCYGNATISTPHLDALADAGARFSDFHSNGAVCSPTRAAFLTGRYQQRSGINGVVTAARHRHTGLPLEETTIAEVLQQHGYRTALFGKWHLGYQPKFNPVHQGFDEFVGYVSGNVDYHAHLDQTGVDDWWRQTELVPEEGYTTDLITQHGVEFIQRHVDEPFFLYLAHEAPHYPYQGRRDPPRYLPGRGRTEDPTSPEVYREMIAALDDSIGAIRATLATTGLEKRTFLVFFSDNGPTGPGSAGPLRGKKGQLWEGGHRVPALAVWPGRIPAGTRIAQTAMGTDLFPTILDAAGMTPPQTLKLDGFSLLQTLETSAPLPERAVFWMHRDQLAIRQGAYKLLTDIDFTSPQLYDLHNDLAETTDQATRRPKRTEQMLMRLKAWHQEVTEGVTPRS